MSRYVPMGYFPLKNRQLLICFFTAIFLFFSSVAAECLGLEPPAPQTTNVCEILVEQLVIPKAEVFCDIPPYARVTMPQCNLPGACHIDPSCKIFEASKEVSSILNSGDLYCDTREISPEKMIENIKNQSYTDLIKLTTGGTSSVLFNVANSHIDTMVCSGFELNEKLKGVINRVTSKSTARQDEYFYPVDINRVRIISDKNPTANLYLREGFDAITLNDLVIIRDQHFQILRNWNKNAHIPLDLDEQYAAALMIHELVHVRQYRNMGKEVFVNTYLSEALVKGYADISAEQEASNFENWAKPILAEDVLDPLIPAIISLF